MNRLYYICLIFVLLLAGCKQTVVIDSNDQVQTLEGAQVRIRFNIKASFPEGVVIPDMIYMDGRELKENSLVGVGKHNFIIEKAGYERKIADVNVENQDKKGNFYLILTLKAKERVIIFDIRDKKTNAVIKPDKVVMATIPNGIKERITDRAYVEPGNKEVVIQKEGYMPLAQTILVNTEEGPYFLEAKLTPVK